MSKRRVTKQQARRIENQHNLKEVDEKQNMFEGLVICRYHKHADVEDDRGIVHYCAIKPSIKSLVAGDKVIWKNATRQQGQIISRLPRNSVLARPNARGQLKPVAANVTRLIIVIAPKPEVSWTLLDCYLIMAEKLKIQPVIVLNKVDIDSSDTQNTLINEYKSIGYDVILTSIHDPKSIDSLKSSLENQISVFIGQSGVGKSSLISMILPEEEDIRTAELSENIHLGRHTTSLSKYYKLQENGAIIDSPGVREFSLGHLDKADILNGYPDLKPYTKNCQFRNCTHINEKNCGLKKAIDEGKLSHFRYQHFIKVIEQNN